MRNSFFFFAIITIVFLSKHVCTRAAAGRFLCNQPQKSIYQSSYRTSCWSSSLLYTGNHVIPYVMKKPPQIINIK